MPMWRANKARRKESYEESRRRRRLEQRVTRRIEELEGAIGDLEKQMQQPHVAHDWSKLSKLQEEKQDLERQRDELYLEWEGLVEG